MGQEALALKDNVKGQDLASQLIMPALFQKAKKGEARFFLEFGGQAASYIDELCTLYNSYPLLRELISLAASALSEEAKNPQATASGFLSEGFDLLSWIKNPESTPSASYLASAVLSQPLIFVTQVGNYRHLVKYVCAQSELLNATTAATGHSQGVMSAVLAALNLSDENFLDTFQKMVRYFFWQGVRMQEAYPMTVLAPELVKECEDNDWGIPSPMAAVAQISQSELESIILQVNSFLPENKQIGISLINTHKRYVVSGSPVGLVYLRRALAKEEVKAKKQPYTQFKPRCEFLAVSAPYHCQHMAPALEAFKSDVKRIGLKLDAKDLILAVYDTETGADLRGEKDILNRLIELQFVKPVDWTKCTAHISAENNITHVIDFGPGDMTMKLTGINREGAGVVVESFAVKSGKEALLTTDKTKLRAPAKLWKDYAPKLVTLADGTLALDNAFVRHTHRAPIFGGGMTPTTVETDIVIAAVNGGYLVEWAGGGQVTEAILRKRLGEIKAGLNPGQGIIFNALYLDSYLWNLHFPLITKLKAQGYPIDGLTVSAGIPTREKAHEILTTLNDAGVWCNAFKPGSDDQIKAVLEIADDHPQYKIIMHIEGGKAGGHHSWEDLQGLLERNYAAIRRRENVILCAGGGVGLESEAWQLLAGTWHESGRIMPVDAVILGTRLMAAKEAKTSPQIKELLVKLAGAKNWVGRGEFNGGVTSGQSQLGADVHYADNATSRTANFVDQISVKDEKEIFARKDEIIAALAKTAKPYFGDLTQMTYAQVLTRMVSLMAPGNMPDYFISDGAWFDVSFRTRFLDFCRRTLERVAATSSVDFNGAEIIANPQGFLKAFFKLVPDAQETRVIPEDADYFLALCRRPGKPVNFVPVIDSSLKRWFKSDSLWQAHDPRYSAEEVLTIPGITAVKGITKANEPVTEIFKGFVGFAVDALKATVTGTPQKVAYLGAPSPATQATLAGVVRLESGNADTLDFVIESEDIHSKAWLDFIASQGSGAVSVLLSAPWIFEKGAKRANYFAQILYPEVGAKLSLEVVGGKIALLLYTDKAGTPLVEIKTKIESSVEAQIEVTLAHQSATGEIIPVTLEYDYDALNPQAPISRCDDQAVESLNALYRKLWLGEAPKTKANDDIWQSFVVNEIIDAARVQHFVASVQDKMVAVNQGAVPPTFSIVLLWRALSQCLMQKGLAIDFTSLLHLSNKFSVIGSEPLLVGDDVTASVRLMNLSEEVTGKTILIEGLILKNDAPVIRIQSAFLVRTLVLKTQAVTQTRVEKTVSLELTPLVLELLKTKDWCRFTTEARVNSLASVTVTGFERKAHDGKRTDRISGQITQAGCVVAEICYDDGDSRTVRASHRLAPTKNPVLYFLAEHALTDETPVAVSQGRVITATISSPTKNQNYALASFDFNPIHTDHRIAAVASLPCDEEGLPITIVHGMWTAAASLSALNAQLPQAVTTWHTDFVGMVKPGTKLSMSATHTTNAQGKMIYDVRTTTSKGELVLSGKVYIKQNSTAYLFTGQGSQVTGMGMPAYAAEPAARRVWDAADLYCRTELGFSILTVVRDNPKEMYVRGALVTHPKGVLNLTQFAQVALTVLAMSQINELKAKGLYVDDAVFAGHSLGEYAALSSSDIIPLNQVIKTVYHRGLTMQNFVPRDSAGRSPYAMIVVRPHIAGLKEEGLVDLVNRVAATDTSRELYLVNYNIEGSQYAVTGRVELLEKLITSLVELEKKKGATKASYVRIEGVDVPFHSAILMPGVAAFRETLEQTIPVTIDAKKLIGRYIPNLNAEMFSIELDYIERVQKLTLSPVLKSVLAEWHTPRFDRSKLARTLLIELLAYQFASPVQWIKTQKLVLDMSLGLKRVIEIGPGPVLANMLKATLTRELVPFIPTIHHMDSERDAVFYKFEASDDDAPSPTASPVSAAPVAPLSASTPIAAARPTASAVAPEDKSFSIAQGLKSLLALKLNIRENEIGAGETLEALSGGNSARRNEILADIGAEFQIGAIDEAHLKPFDKLVDTLTQKVNYAQPGAFLQKAIERVLKEKLSLSKKEAFDHLASERLLGPGLSQAALVYAALVARTGNSSRAGALSAMGLSERLSDRTAAISFIDKSADAFGTEMGIVIPQRGAQTGGAESLVGAEALKTLEDKYFGPEGPFLPWAKNLINLCEPLAKPESIDVSEELKTLQLYREGLGSGIDRVLTPLFEPAKKVSFKSQWNWLKRDFVKLAFAKIRDKETLSQEQIAHWETRGHKGLAGNATYFAKLATAKKLDQLAKQFDALATAFSDSVTSTPKPAMNLTMPQVTLNAEGVVQYTEVTRAGVDSGNWLDTLTNKHHLSASDETLLNAIRAVCQEGLDLTGKTALITGASPGSIAWDVAGLLLSFGAKVVATTSSYNEARLKEFGKLYQRSAVLNAELHVLPFNQGSLADIDGLMSWCFANYLIPDYLMPFAAGSEAATLSMMKPDASFATLRVLLQGVEWLIVAVARHLKAIHAVDRRCLAILPLSPNHGHFGGDGAYADAKLGLESLLHRWHAEKADWGNHVTLVGTTIGWVRGTGLMSANNILAAAMEKNGVRTFATGEASVLIAGLCHPDVAERCEKKPTQLNFSGGFETINNLNELATREREAIEAKAKLARAVFLAGEKEARDLNLAAKEKQAPAGKASIAAIFPKLPKENELTSWRQKSKAGTAHDPIVVVGYGEVSPFGLSRARFEMECDGELSPNGAIELAWIMGLIRYENGLGKTPFVGWVDAKTAEPLGDDQIWSKYREVISKNTGVRFADETIQNFDPRAVVVFGDVILENAFSFVAETEDALQGYQKQYAGKMSAEKLSDGTYRVTLAKGSVIKVPRRVSLTRSVAGQIPQGFDAVRFGVPAVLAKQVDRTTLYNFVSSALAFVSCGATPVEVTKNLHPTRVGNSQGGGMGGMKALDRVYHDFREDRERQGDALQETLINVGPAWVNQALVGGYGPTVNPVAACATAVVSLAVGMDLINAGKADFIVAGGFDDYSEEGVVGFQDMNATCDTADMLKKGITPKGMSRPNDARRSGFVEAQGGGTLLLTRFSVAIKMGLPIYTVIGYANNFTDGVHTSIPAPGLGLLGAASGGDESPLAKALSNFGLNTNDIGVVSKHDTSTAANDPNENKLHDTIQKLLGRDPGNPLLVHSQKAILGHAKGGAGAWQAIAALQMLQTGRVPGNRNLEDVDGAMRVFENLIFSDETIDLGAGNLKAVIFTSLGFGHVGAGALFIHPHAVLGTLTPHEYQDYAARVTSRENLARESYYAGFLGTKPFFSQRQDRLGVDDEINLLTKKDVS